MESKSEKRQSTSEIFLQKQRSTDRSGPNGILESDEYTEQQESSFHGQDLTLFWRRAIVLVVGPLLIAAYFLWIWLYCLNHDNLIRFAQFDQIWIFYTWFIVGVFGLNLSRYGLAGAEASMLQTSFWQAHDAMVVLTHGDSTWSGPGGWTKYLVRIISRKQSHTGRLWHLLATLSLLPFIALPLSGLTMELTDGYVPSTSIAEVVGRRFETYNVRELEPTIQNAYSAWSTGIRSSLPGFGLIYTPKSLNRAEFGNLRTVPNRFPETGGVTEAFLPAQAEFPVAGQSYGMRLGYDCSTVTSASELTILNRKSDLEEGIRNTPDFGKQFSTFRSASSPNVMVSFFNSSTLNARNIWAYAEVGTNLNSTSYNDVDYHSNPELRFSGLQTTVDILEVALWQIRRPGSYGELDTFNTSVEPSVAGLSRAIVQNDTGSYVPNRQFFSMNGTNTDTAVTDLLMEFADPDGLGPILSVAPPIAVRCRRTSELGYAHLDWETTSFTDFRPSTNPLTDGNTTSPAPRFGNIAGRLLVGSYIELFDSLRESPRRTLSNSQWYSQFVQPQTLLRSVMRAHEVDALQLMYDGGGSMFGAVSNSNLTIARPARILGIGAVPPALPAVLLLIWAIGCAILGLLYGFRRRWSVSLDGYSFFRFGVDLADNLRGDSEFSSVRPFDEYGKLTELPGLVGDLRPNKTMGRVSLVHRRNVIDLDKRFE